MSFTPAALPPDGAFDAQRRHWLAVRVYYEDTDFTGMVYHANYLRFCERGRSAHLRTAGVTHRQLLDRPDPAAFAVLRAEIDFRRPGRVDDLLAVRSEYLGVEGARMGFRQTVLRDGETLAEVRVSVVTIHADGRARRPIPDIAAQLEAFRADAQGSDSKR